MYYSPNTIKLECEWNFIIKSFIIPNIVRELSSMVKRFLVATLCRNDWKRGLKPYNLITSKPHNLKTKKAPEGALNKE